MVEYASPVIHDSLTQFLSNDLELIQKRAMKVIFPKATYDQALNFANIHSLKKRRQDLTDKLFHEITSNEDHRLNSILPSRNFNNFNLRKILLKDLRIVLLSIIHLRHDVHSIKKV